MAVKEEKATNNEYWVISAPADPTCEDSWKKLLVAMSKYPECSLYKFYIPNLKVGTLDQLFAVSEEFGRIENLVDGMISRLADMINELLDYNPYLLNENILAEKVSLHHYLITFKWDMAKYPTRQSIRSILYLIEKKMTTTESDLNQKIRVYSKVLSAYNNCEKKRTGNLLTKYIGDYVSKDDFILDSEFLMTVVVAVPQALKFVWFVKYERLHIDVIPRSTKLIAEDEEYLLYIVVIFRRSLNEFKANAKAEGYTVRDFVYDEDEINDFRKELYDTYQQKHRSYQSFLRWCISNFSECFIASAHVKASKVFVESVLRYGLPANFQPMLLVLKNKKNVLKIRTMLEGMYKHLSSAPVPSLHEFLEENALIEPDYYPYVYTRIRANISEIITSSLPALT